jgi:hypothetical protein
MFSPSSGSKQENGVKAGGKLILAGLLLGPGEQFRAGTEGCNHTDGPSQELNGRRNPITAFRRPNTD